MRAYRTPQAVVFEDGGKFYPSTGLTWDEFVRADQVAGDVHEVARLALRGPALSFDPSAALAPIGQPGSVGRRRHLLPQPRGAHGGVERCRRRRLLRSRLRRRAPRALLQSHGRRVVGPGATVRIRSDAQVVRARAGTDAARINPRGEIIGFTIGNDMSSRDIEGENPLYLPQAKVYDGSCALGPCMLLSPRAAAESTAIRIEIDRDGQNRLRRPHHARRLKRDPKELVDYLFRDNSFPDGAFLMTGTGIVPGDEFTLHHGDLIRITIEGIGTLENRVA